MFALVFLEYIHHSDSKGFHECILFVYICVCMFVSVCLSVSKLVT